MNGESIGAPAPWASATGGPAAGPSKIIPGTSLAAAVFVPLAIGPPPLGILHRYLFSGNDDSDVRPTGGDRPSAGGEPAGGPLRAAPPRPLPVPGLARPRAPAAAGLETNPARKRRPRRLPLEPRPRDPRPLHGVGGEDQRRGLHRLPGAL